MPELTVFDHYEVLRREDGSLFELGRGAMGITYKAFDTNLRCPVALKIINGASIHSDLARQRFVREARAAAQLRHRNVASVFHLGVAEDTYFYAMEFIEGETVESLIRRRGPVQPILAFRIAVQVARALNAAQKHQLVHRDIKPSNLMLVREDEEVVVKVIDFGLAKSSRGEDSTGELALAAAGFVGTPHFASPEQLEERDLDVRSDIYSLGVTLWYMLTGEAPFGGSLAQVMSHHLHTPPPAERLAFLPEAVRRVVIEMLAKKPEQRPQNPVELRAKLEACVGFLVAAQPAGTDSGNEVVLAPETNRGSGTILKAKGFYAGAIVAGRYELLRDLGESNAGWTFQVEDLRDGRKLRMLVLQADWASDSGALTQIEREVEKLGALEHPNILRVLGIERTSEVSFILLEWTEGFSLVDLLRSRQEIDADESILLLRELAAGVDEAISLGFKHLDFSLGQIFVHFKATDKEPERRITTPVDRWPPFLVKINPLGITRDFATSDTWAGGQTIVGSLDATRDPADGPGRHYVQSLASVVYELLGGALSPGMASSIGTQAISRYVPVAALPESGNDVVKRALDPRTSFGSAMEFCKALEASLTGNYRPPAHPAIVPAPSLHPETPGTVSVFDTRAVPPVVDPRSATTQPAAGRFAQIPRLGLAVAVGLVLAALGLWLMFRPAAPPPQPVATATPAPPEELPAATPAPSIANSLPSASASPLSADDAMNAALLRAEKFEHAQDSLNAIQAYVDFTRSYPTVDAGRRGLGTLLNDIAPTLEKMSPGDFAPYRPAITAAASQGDLTAMFILATQLRSVAPTDAFNWYCAAAGGGNAAAITQAGLMISNGNGVPRDLIRAARWFQRAADAGDTVGRTVLAECYLYGTGVKKDEQHAIKLLQKSADDGDVRAMNILGNCYHKGIGVPKDYKEAFNFFSRAHDAGYEDAAGNLGVLYMNGDGVPRDPRQAVNLFKTGAEDGNPYCMYLFAKCLESGAGITENLPLAQQYYGDAAAAGDPGAIAWCNAQHIPIPKPSP